MSTERTPDHVSNVNVGHEPGFEDLENAPCTPMEHEGRPVKVFVIGPNDQPVRKVTTCTACNMQLEEVQYDDAHAVELQGRGQTVDRVINYPDKERLVKVPLEDAIDEDREDINGVGLSPDGELLFSVHESDPTAKE